MGIFNTGKGKVMKAANQAEDARMGRLTQNQSQINAAFDAPGREAQRQDFLGALRAQYADQLGRGYADNARNLKFSLAKRGLTGGSADVDAQSRLQQALARGRLQAEGNAQSAYSNLLGQDEAQRFDLLGAARSGVATGQAARQASLGMQARLTGAMNPLDVGANAFSSFASDLRDVTQRAEARRGAASIWGTP